ncbi:MAG TPA: DsbA family protein [Solirubrobacterales bacterium]|nr:DsbA family protein [Solirubrobacterales bacterium]
MPVEVSYYTDPACSWSWASEPKLRKLMWEFGDALRFRWVMGGLARDYGDEYRDEEAGITGQGSCFDGLMSHWLDVGAETGMPIDPRLWRRNPISSTYPACLAVKAASEQGAERAYAYLRRLREGLMCELKKLDHVEALVGEAGPAGLDVERFRIDVVSNAITEAFGADLDEVRDPPDAARDAGQVKTTEGHQRLSFPSAVFEGEDGSRHGVWGWSPYDDYREAALAAGAEVAEGRPPAPIEAVERFGRAATKEIEVLTGKPGPVVRAELWEAARDWRLRPVPVVGGEIWEPA